MRRNACRRSVVACAHHNAVGMQKIDDRRAFAQELGVRNHIELFLIDAVPVQHAANPVVGVDRNGALLHDHLVALDRARNLRHHSLNVGKVRCAAIALWRAHGDEDGLALFHGLCQIRGEHHFAAAVLLQQLRQMLLKDGHTALAELLDPGFIVVDANDIVTHVSKTGGRHETDVSRPDHTN